MRSRVKGKITGKKIVFSTITAPNLNRLFSGCSESYGSFLFYDSGDGLVAVLEVMGDFYESNDSSYMSLNSTSPIL